MEQSKAAFMSRLDELSSAYNELVIKQGQLAKRIAEIRQQLQLSVAISSEMTTEDLLSKEPMKDNSFIALEKEIEKLKKEHTNVSEKLRAVPVMGGKNELFKTDKQLTKLAEPLAKEMIRQTKEDIKKRRDLEKRYSKLIDELIQLDQERNEFLTDGVNKRNLMNIICENTKVKLTLSELQDYHNTYLFPVPNDYVYQGINNVHRLIKEYKKSGMM